MIEEIPELYEARFDDRSVAAKHAIWREIVGFLQRYVDASAPVLDVGCDRGYFIGAVRGSERWATDVRDMRSTLPLDVRFVQGSGLALDAILPAGHFGTIFMSNYLEHLGSAEDVIKQFHVASRLLRPGGRVVVLQPNIRLIGGRYWDFIDHKVPLTEQSLIEAAQLAGISTVEVITRFLPYSTKGRLPAHPALVKAYLRVRAMWLLMGRQTLFIGQKP